MARSREANSCMRGQLSFDSSRLGAFSLKFKSAGREGRALEKLLFFSWQNSVSLYVQFCVCLHALHV